MRDRDFLMHRAQRELELARRAAASAVIAAHYRRTAIYLERLLRLTERSSGLGGEQAE
ncbi:hypothetical protein ACFOMD_03730 [Sphingoaurantiacus capsulatus]|uniref:Uncharacterized protein n=1 Tax=Sphingoaurantiacus capsulatus TaxID=1771310 RepID=A0ABV7X886_9SPHN